MEFTPLLHSIINAVAMPVKARTGFHLLHECLPCNWSRKFVAEMQYLRKWPQCGCFAEDRPRFNIP